MDVDLHACLSGSKDAWERFVERYAGVIAAAVRRTLGSGGRHGDRSEIDDTIQETFVRLIQHDHRLLRTFDPERASLTTWLTLIARSTAIDRLRRRRLEAVPLEGIDPPQQPLPASDPPEVPLHLLSARQRLVMRMLFDESMTVAEAALVIGVDEQTIRSTKHKALCRLREHLEQQRAPSSGLAGMPRPPAP
jgi:RNA polymerase sigma-70 factor (ECF subfamily)